MSLVALSLCILFTLLLFLRDRKIRPLTSGALWIPLIWIMINGSRHVSAWFSAGIETETPDSYLEGTPLDRNIYLFLIIAGLVILIRRKVDWSTVFSGSRWLFAFFAFWALSTLWSDYPFISMKRWIKDMGNIIMVLVIFTETAPGQALRGIFSRYVAFALPFSVLMIHFFPDLGSYQDKWAPDAAFSGISTNKNGLGIILVVSGISLAWDFMETWVDKTVKRDLLDLLTRTVLALMLAWLLIMARSATALVCLPVGIAVLLSLRFDVVRRQLSYLGIYSLAAASLVLVLDFFPMIIQTVATMVGRDATFTGRTDIWNDLLREGSSPLVGAGYQSFWLRHGIMEKYGDINQAHNGYLETYLNGGLMGVGLLVAMIAATGNKLRRDILHGSRLAALLFVFLLVATLYNLTEGLFNGMSLIWFITLVAGLSHPRSAHGVVRRRQESAPLTGIRRLMPTTGRQLR